MNFIKKVVPYFIIAAVLSFLLWNIIKNWNVLIHFPWRFNLTNIIFLIIFLFPIYVVNVFSWHLLTRALGANIPYLKNFRLWIFSNAGRFLPGSIWQYAGRVYLANQLGMSKPQATTAVIIEALFVLLIGALIVLFTLTFWQLPLGLVHNRQPITAIAAVGILILIIIITFLGNERIATCLVMFLRKITKKKDVLHQIKIPPIYLLPVMGSVFLQFLLGGIVLFLLSQNVIGLSVNLIPTFVGIYAASWLLGYISIFAPSGFGVQEITLAGLLSTYMPFSLAIVIAILFRILFLLSEILALLFSVVYPKLKFTKN